MDVQVPVPLERFDLVMGDGAVIRVRRHGRADGVRLFVSSGNGFAVDGYYPFWGPLGRWFEIIAFDFRNHGQNPRATSGRDGCKSRSPRNAGGRCYSSSTSTASATDPRGESMMRHVRLGRTGLPVSRLCLGTMTFGLQCDEAASVAILDRAAAGGITFVDTSDVYPLGGDRETVGRTEEILGRWLHGRRQDFIVATKCFGAVGDRPWDRGLSRKHVLGAIDGSLRRLRTDYVDLYQLHHPDPATPIDESLRALDDVVRAGKARYVGCSNYFAYQVARALGRSELLGLARFDCVQPRYNLLFRQVERELFPLCAEEGVGVIAYNPIAGGLLSGKHRRQAGPLVGTRFSHPTAGARYRERYWHERELDTVEALRPLAAEAGMSMVQMAVAWVLANPVVTAPIVGASRPEQLDDVLAAADKGLEAGLKARLDELTREYRWGDDIR